MCIIGLYTYCSKFSDNIHSFCLTQTLERFLYQSGFDKTGQPLMVFLAQRWVDDELFIIQRRASNSNLSPAQILRERLKLFFIHQMHIVVKEKYSFLYVHNLTNKTQPSPECLRDLLKILDPQ